MIIECLLINTTELAVLQVKNGKIIYLNCGERYEDMKDYLSHILHPQRVYYKLSFQLAF